MPSRTPFFDLGPTKGGSCKQTASSKRVRLFPLLFALGLFLLLSLLPPHVAHAAQRLQPCQATVTLANKDVWLDFWKGIVHTGGSDKLIVLDACTFASLQSAEIPANLVVDDRISDGWTRLRMPDLPPAIGSILWDHLIDLVVFAKCPGGALPGLLIPYQDWLNGSGYYIGSTWSTSYLSQHSTVFCP